MLKVRRVVVVQVRAARNPMGGSIVFEAQVPRLDEWVVCNREQHLASAGARDFE